MLFAEMIGSALVIRTLSLLVPCLWHASGILLRKSTLLKEFSSDSGNNECHCVLYRIWIFLIYPNPNAMLCVFQYVLPLLVDKSDVDDGIQC